MDPFALIMLGLVGGLLVALILLGKYYPGSGADVLDWKPTRSPEVEAQNEVDDLEEMLEAQNERRRRRGEAERTLDDVEADVAAARRLQDEYRESVLGDPERDDVDEREMLDAINARRRARGEADASLEDFEPPAR